MTINTNNWLLKVFIVIVILLSLYVLHKSLCSTKIPEGYVLVKQEVIDSLDAYKAMSDSLRYIANLPPDTIVIVDTIYFDTVSTAITIPTVIPTQNDSIFHYKDSLKYGKDIDVKIAFDVKGKLVTPITWTWKPVVKHTKYETQKYIPYPVIRTINKKIPSTGNYLSLGAGGNDKMFIFGVDYDFVKENNIYGLQYRRYGDFNVYGFKIGINLNTIFKR